MQKYDDTFDYENKPVMRIGVDFDGVVHNSTKGWNGGKVYGTMMPDAFEMIADLEKKGYEIVIITARDKLEPVKEWMSKHGMGHILVTNVKLPCRAYIDDRAIRFTNWRDIRSYFA